TGAGDGAHALIMDDSGGRGIERLFARLLPRRAQLRLRLRRAGLALSVGRYAAVSAGAAVVSAGLLKALFGFSFVLAVLAGLVVGLMGPHMVVGIRIARRTARFVQLFPEAIDLMVRGLKSGLPIG